MSDATDRIVAIKAVSDLVQPDTAPVLTSGQVELEVDRAKLASSWSVSTVYSLGNVIVVGNGHAYETIQSGTSHSIAHPLIDWPAHVGATFTDGSSNPVLTWREIGTARFNPGTTGAEYNVYDIQRAAMKLCDIKIAKSVEYIAAGEHQFQQVHEHWVRLRATFRPFRRPIELIRA